MNVAEDHLNNPLDDMDYETGTDPPFIGRERDLRLLHEAYHLGYRLFGVFGIRSIGKSRLVKEFLKIISVSCNCEKNTTTKKESNDCASDYKWVESNSCWSCDILPTIIHLDLEHHTDTDSVYANLCASIGETPEINNAEGNTWILQIIKYVEQCKNKHFIFFFDNVEHAENNSELANGLKSLFWQLTSYCVNSRVFITSTTKFMTSRLNNVYFTHELLPLRPTESTELLKAIAPEVDLGEYRDVIVKLSEGLPLLLSMIANELAGLITPKDMAELLATSRVKCLSRRDFYVEEDSIADIYKKFINRLHVMYRRRLSILGYIPGSFDVREAKEILGFDTDAQTKDQALVPIRRRYMLTFDPETKRFNIQGILRECLDVFFAIRNITDVRKKFCSVFSDVMAEIDEDLGTAETARALARFSLEQPNFQKLMTEVYHTTEDTYRFFITMAKKCTDLIERFLLKDCGKFYDGCLVMAARYGDTLDTAVVCIAVGSMWTNARGEFLKGEEYYREALKVLVPKGNRLQQATIYQRLGWNLHSQGKCTAAIGYFRESLNISQKGGPEFDHLHFQSLNSLGLACILLGNYQDAENYHFMSLRRAKATLTDDDPRLGIIYSNIGVLYSEMGDPENAVRYYLKGLENKKKNHAHENSLNISFSNLAGQYIKLENYDEAINLLDESLELALKRDPPLKTVLALIHNTKGKVFMAQNKYLEALAMFDVAVDLRESVSPDSVAVVESLVRLSDVKRRLRKNKSSIKTARKALALKDKAAEGMPPNTFIVECYQCLADMYERVGTEREHLEALTGLANELSRLEDVHKSACNKVQLACVRKKLDDVRGKLERFAQQKKSTLQTNK